MNFEELMKKLLADNALSNKMSSMTSAEDAYAFARELGYTASEQEFMDNMKKLSETNSEISAEDVDAIVGGASTDQIVSAALLGTDAVVATAIAAASI